MEEVVDKLHLDMDYKKLVKKIEVENPKDTRILSISAQDPDAEMAKRSLIRRQKWHRTM